MHFVTLGTTQVLVENLWDRLAKAGNFRFSHIVHPILYRESWENVPPPSNVHFIGEDAIPKMPVPDLDLLSSLETVGVPTVHNMICGDFHLSRLDYGEALAYATFLTQRLIFLYEALRPSVVVGGFDGVHGSLGLAVARKMRIPWVALHFTVIPTGFACFCDRMSPAARVRLSEWPHREMRSVAEDALVRFENGKIQAPAYIAPSRSSLAGKIAKLPDRFAALRRTVRKARRRQYLRFVEDPSGHDVRAVLRHFRRTAVALSALAEVQTISAPPNTPYVLFGLHRQPESSIDVWAPFFSNQLWVVELLARSIPPSHKLLVKIHKSDLTSLSREQLVRMRGLPGVELVAPFADTRAFIDKTDLLFTIQGTIGLESALLGKPVIVLGESPLTVFPSVSPMSKITDLPDLVRLKLRERAPTRDQILDAFREYLAPFAPAGHNDWTIRPEDREIDRFADLFGALGRFIKTHGAQSTVTASLP
jgi:hypothetical protein